LFIEIDKNNIVHYWENSSKYMLSYRYKTTLAYLQQQNEWIAHQQNERPASSCEVGSLRSDDDPVASPNG
jgi:hypothetical protein